MPAEDAFGDRIQLVGTNAGPSGCLHRLERLGNDGTGTAKTSEITL